MKKIFLLIISIFTFLSAQSQILDPVKWKTKIEKISETEFNLILEGKIDADWHMYSQFTPDGGPLPTELKFTKGNFELIGKTTESKTRTEFSEIFEVNEIFFEKNVTLTQKVKVSKPAKSVKVSLSYQVCKNVCINQDKSFEFLLPTSNATAGTSTLNSTDSIKKSVVNPISSIDTTASKTNKNLALQQIDIENNPEILLYGISSSELKKVEAVSNDATVSPTISKSSFFSGLSSLHFSK